MSVLTAALTGASVGSGSGSELEILIRGQNGKPAIFETHAARAGRLTKTRTAVAPD